MALHTPLTGLAGSAPPPGGDASDRRLDLTVGPPARVPSEPPPGRLVLATTVERRAYHWAAAVDAGYVLRVPAVAEFAVAGDGTRATVRPAPDVGPDALVLLVRGLLVAFTLSVIGECVLHASAVAVDEDGGAVAFAGPSGAGKSTLAAAACADGARFVTDDVLRVGGGPVATWVGRAAELRMRPGAPGMPERWGRRITPDGRTGVRPPSVAMHHGPLLAVVLPVPVPEGSTPTVRRLAGPQAVTRLVAAHRIVHWVDPALRRQQLAQAAALARSVPVVVAEVPWGLPPPVRSGADLLYRVLDLARAG